MPHPSWHHRTWWELDIARGTLSGWLIVWKIWNDVRGWVWFHLMVSAHQFPPPRTKLSWRSFGNPREQAMSSLWPWDHRFAASSWSGYTWPYRRGLHLALSRRETCYKPNHSSSPIGATEPSSISAFARTTRAIALLKYLLWKPVSTLRSLSTVSSQPPTGMWVFWIDIKKILVEAPPPSRRTTNMTLQHSWVPLTCSLWVEKHLKRCEFPADPCEICFDEHHGLIPLASSFCVFLGSNYYYYYYCCCDRFCRLAPKCGRMEPLASWFCHANQRAYRFLPIWTSMCRVVLSRIQERFYPNCRHKAFITRTLTVGRRFSLSCGLVWLISWFSPASPCSWGKVFLYFLRTTINHANCSMKRRLIWAMVSWLRAILLSRIIRIRHHLDF